MVLVLFLNSYAYAAQRDLTSLLTNPDFETDPVQAGWRLTVYGARPEIARDSSVHKHGRSSLRISAGSPSDAALSQDISLPPGHLYTLRGWVMTRGLDPHGASVSGTLQVQRVGGATISSAASHSGDTPWTEVSVPFYPPPDGRVHICIFFVGFGKGTGAALVRWPALGGGEPGYEHYQDQQRAAACRAD